MKNENNTQSSILNNVHAYNLLLLIEEGGNAIDTGCGLVGVAAANGLLQADLHSKADIAIWQALLVDTHLLPNEIVDAYDIFFHLVASILNDGLCVGILLAAETNHGVGNGCAGCYGVLLGNSIREESLVSQT